MNNFVWNYWRRRRFNATMFLYDSCTREREEKRKGDETKVQERIHDCEIRRKKSG